MTSLFAPLTPEQRSRLEACRQKWIDLAHTTQPIDAQRVTALVLEFYTAFGQPTPDVVVCPGVVSARTDALTDRPPGHRLREALAECIEWSWATGMALVVYPIWYGGAAVFILCLLIAVWCEVEGVVVDNTVVNTLTLLVRISFWGTLPAGIAAGLLWAFFWSCVDALVSAICDRLFWKLTERPRQQAWVRSRRAKPDAKSLPVRNSATAAGRSPSHPVNVWQSWMLEEFQRLHLQIPEAVLRAVWQVCIHSDRPQNSVDSSQFARDFLNRRCFEDWQERAQRAFQHLLTAHRQQSPSPGYSWAKDQMLAQSSLEISLLAPYFTMLDFCEAELGYQPDSGRWRVVRQLMESTGYVIMGRRTCWVGDRPMSLQRDRQGRFHADGQPALDFADGARLYAHHGVFLPPLYGQTPIADWRPRWLLQETNATLRQILIRGMGYERIALTLQARSVDRWREYVLYAIPTHPDVEPFLLLQMTCPSTQQLHVIRVPPTLQTARAAARWVNWDIDPADFAIET
ncbi:DUF6745 domain-containing protein [Thermoleptolyngbya sp.]